MVQSGGLNGKAVLVELGLLGLSLLGTWAVLHWALRELDPDKESKRQGKRAQRALAARLQRPVHIQGPFEQAVAGHVVDPGSIRETLADIGAHGAIIEDLRRNVLAPMRRPDLFCTSLLRQKRGILLYGPPGTGKTMLAKALARESGAHFIAIRASTILSKWYCDTNKTIAAIWSLASKLQPCILFLDEVEALLGRRSLGESEATTAMKCEFLSLWDGFETAPGSQIVVLGATNRIDRLDDAVMRRFSLQYQMRLPGEAGRASILAKLLLSHARELYLELRAVPRQFETAPIHYQLRAAGVEGELLQDGSSALQHIAAATAGYSGSDLAELCAQAAALPMRRALAVAAVAAEKEQQQQQQRDAPSASADGSPVSDTNPKLEALSAAHFEEVLASFQPPSRRVQRSQRGGAGAPMDVVAALRRLLGAVTQAAAAEAGGGVRGGNGAPAPA